MTRVSPPELDRVFPGPHESINSTRAPRPRRWSAVQPPKAPAPTTATRGLEDPATRAWASRRPASRTAATHSRNVRRVAPSPDPEDITSCAPDPVSEVDARTDADRPRLVGQIAHPCPRSALLIQCQKSPLVGDVVDEKRRIPTVLEDADAQVQDVVARHLRVARAPLPRYLPPNF